MQNDMVIHKGGCHCGRVRFAFEGPANVRVAECNCSICGKSGFLGMSVPKDKFRLIKGEDSLATYSFGTGVAKHTFCNHCGIKSFYTPRSHPDGINVNVRCLDPETIESKKIIPFDGRNWEEQYPAGKATAYSNYPSE